MKQIKTMGYYGICTTSQDSGVFKKINGFISAANLMGYSAASKIINGGFGSHIKLTKAVSLASENILIVRGNSYGLFLLMFGIILARLRGKKVIIDNATPMSAVFYEINKSASKFFIKFFKNIGLLLSGPWTFWVANSVLQYAPENFWFSLGAKNKMILIGNGIDVSNVPIRKKVPAWPSMNLQLIAVAHLANWHGYDRIIKAISEFNKKIDKKFEIFFTIVGTGSELIPLQMLVKQLSLENHVIFTGSLQGDELYKRYGEAHIGISSLGLHRIGLNFSSVLKSREYCAIGIPFISGGIDPDFSSDLDFVYKVDLSEDFTSIVNLFESFESGVKFPSPAIIRNYADENLNFQVKLKLIFGHPSFAS